ncbi:hypothetical protein CMQ_2480 [Grosmannia clavigera kw1407]|uniref:Uncharacterized protein n=1 Tax=Grosmannia clavigera (strain kw1407 / UAMH 11150) TaxID=655863 RepID=F0XIR5_GROCL|nr:uncharacterized protein CMQ_2480 [Grosmannia clavigera kw1407]EFX02431.1 hypothetical protein CMQ_2480 [Grosmannia clavigera kw1407]
MDFTMRGCERMGNPVYPCCQTKKHRDSTRRRRSANADILESVGLPTTGSFHDMKSLHGNTLYQVTHRRDRLCGLRTAVKSMAKAAKAAVTRSRAMARKTAKLDTPARRRYMSWTKDGLRHRGLSMHSSASSETHDQGLPKMRGGYSHSSDLAETMENELQVERAGTHAD